MGLLYEFSRLDDFAYNHIPVPQPDVVEDDTPEEAAAAQPPPGISSADIAVAGAIIIVGFLVLAFVAAMTFSIFIIAQNPDVIDENAGPLTFAQTQDLIAPYIEGNVYVFMVGFVIYTLAMLGGVMFIGFRADWDWAEIGLFGLSRYRAAYAASVGALGSVSMIGTTLIFARLTGALDTLIGGLRETVLDASIPSLVVLFIMGVFMLPLAEELVFRGVLFTWLKQRNGLTYATVFTSFTYAFFNLTPLPLLLNRGRRHWRNSRLRTNWHCMGGISGALRL